MALHRTYGQCHSDVTDLDWSPDSQFLAVASKDITARLVPSSGRHLERWRNKGSVQGCVQGRGDLSWVVREPRGGDLLTQEGFLELRLL